MLLSEHNKGLHWNIYKTIAEFYLEREDNVSKINFKNKSCGEVLKELSNTLFKSIDEVNKFLENYGYTKCNELQNKIYEYVFKYGTSNIFIDYCTGKRMTNTLAKKVWSILKLKPGSKFDVNRIVGSEDFRTFFNAYSSDRLDLDNTVISAWLNQSFEFFIKQNSNKIFNLVNERGTFIKTDEGDLDVAALAAVDISIDKTDFDFYTDMTNILRATAVLYPINSTGKIEDRNNPSKLYFDLVSDYLYQTSENSFNGDFSKTLIRTFIPGKRTAKEEKILYQGKFIPSINISLPVSVTGDEYTRGSYETQVPFVKELFSFINKPFTSRDVNNLYYNLCRIEASKNTNNVKKILDFRNPNSQEDLINLTNTIFESEENKRRFLFILRGVQSLFKLVHYCEEEGIDLESIPKVIFRDESFYKPGGDLKTAIMHAPYKVKLDNEMKNSNQMQCPELAENYSYLKTLIEFGVGNVKFSDIVKYNKPKLKKEDLTIFNGRSLYSVLEGLETMSANANADYIKILTAVIQARNNSNFDNIGDYAFEWGVHRESSESREDPLDEELRDVIFEIFKVDSFEELHSLLCNSTSPYDELIGIIRYVELKWHYINHLKIIVRTLNIQNDFDLITALGDDSKIKLLPSSITGVEDLVDIDTENKSDLFLDASNIDYDEHVISQLDQFGSKIKNDIKGIVDFVEKLVEDRSSRIASFGISVKKEIVISQELEICSFKLYQSEPDVTTCTSLNTIIALAESKSDNYYSKLSGYIVKNNELMVYNNCYVHEKGYLVSFNGECLRSLNENDEL